MTLRDGLYRVTTPNLCAGFIVRDGAVIECAPILRKRLSYWITRAEFVAPLMACSTCHATLSDAGSLVRCRFCRCVLMCPAHIAAVIVVDGLNQIACAWCAGSLERGLRQ